MLEKILEQILELIPGYLLIPVFCTVLFSEVTKRLLANTKLGKKLHGFYYLYPVLFSIFITLVIYFCGFDGRSWRVLPKDILLVYGASGVIYESVVKRVFGDKGGVNEVSSSSNIGIEPLTGDSDDPQQTAEEDQR